jgi:exopolysaccharide biosynthesis predicted pyruvyltransferase EpsI
MNTKERSQKIRILTAEVYRYKLMIDKIKSEKDKYDAAESCSWAEQIIESGHRDGISVGMLYESMRYTVESMEQVIANLHQMIETIDIELEDLKFPNSETVASQFYSGKMTKLSLSKLITQVSKEKPELADQYRSIKEEA